MKSIVVVSSHHHGNTQKVARVIAAALGADVTRPQDVDPEDLAGYDLVGFGSGIDSDRHYKALLDFVDALPHAGSGKKAFIFSTCGIPVAVAGEGSARRYSQKSHAALRERLRAKGFTIISEYACPGFNTNSFLKVFGGLNKGRPNAEDLAEAGDFAEVLAGKREKRTA